MVVDRFGDRVRAGQPGPPRRRRDVRLARKHRDAWLHGYRNVLGFATLVLRRTQPPDYQQAGPPDHPPTSAT
jgi:hypothetical protein